MTTVDKVHDILMSFKGRSPRQIYSDACASLRVKVNSGFHLMLSDVVDDFECIEDLVLEGNYFGSRGCLAVLPIIQSQQRLRHVNLSRCGIDDNVIIPLVDILLDHPRLRSIDLSDNKKISVNSGKHLVRAVRGNVNIIELLLGGTHIGTNVAAVLTRMCDANMKLMEEYFSDDWFRMKDMFLGLDVDGSGWVNVKNIVGSVVFPLVQEKLNIRIRRIKPKKREDNSIDINAFFELTYLNFKTRDEILAKAKEPVDKVYDTIRQNWALVGSELQKHNLSCADLHKFRLRGRTLTEKDTHELCERLLEKQKAAPGPVSAFDVWQASREVVHFNHRVRKSFLSEFKGKTWSLPSSMVSVIIDYFEAHDSATIPASTIVQQTFSTDMETLRVEVLRPQFAKYAIPLDESPLSLQEVVNLLDEYYDVVRTAKPFTTEQIARMTPIPAIAETPSASRPPSTA